jgi:hypothetical protein
MQKLWNFLFVGGIVGLLVAVFGHKLYHFFYLRWDTIILTGVLSLLSAIIGGVKREG